MFDNLSQHVPFVMVALPLVGALMVLLAGRSGIDNVRRMVLTNVLITFALSLVMVANYDPALTDADGRAQLIQMSTQSPWLGTIDADGHYSGSGPDIRFALGVDGVSLWLIALTCVLMIPSVLVSWNAITDRPASFYALMLLLQTGMIGVFAAQDIILFYIFFEFTLIPLFFMIGLWGGHDRRWAARKFFIYTLAGSLLTFLGLLFIVLSYYWMQQMIGLPDPRLTFSIPELTAGIPLLVARSGGIHAYWMQVSPWIFAALFIGFAIKVPLFPFHTWLPLAHVEAPTAGSVLLAGVLLKIGAYGFLRFALPLVPDACYMAFDIIAILSVVGIVYGALLALAQEDIKKLVAYSSVSHMGFCMLGLFALNSVGITGGLLQMINHGLSTGALFTLVGMLYERYHTRDIEAYSGMTRKFPVLAFFFVLVVFSSIGLPGLNGFTGEILSLMGMFRAKPLYGVLGLSGIVLGAWYLLWLVQRVFYGRFREPLTGDSHGPADGHAPAVLHSLPGQSATTHTHDAGSHAAHGHSHEPDTKTVGNPALHDLNFREICALAPLAALIVIIGVYPQYFISRMEPSVAQITATLEHSRVLTAARAQEQAVARQDSQPLSQTAGGQSVGQRPVAKPSTTIPAASNGRRTALDRAASPVAGAADRHSVSIRP